MNFKILSFVLVLSLFGCSTHQGMIKTDTTFKIDGGGTISLPMTRGGALPTETDSYKITSAGTMTALKKGDPENSELTWIFSFASKSKLQVQSVTIEQVTADGLLIPLVQDASPNLKEGHWAGRSRSHPMSKIAAPWLYSYEDSTFLFKFTIVHVDAPAVVMYQPSLLTRQIKERYLQIIKL